LGIPYVAPPKPNINTFYRVMAGSYSVKINAENQVQKLKNSGFDAIIMPFK